MHVSKQNESYYWFNGETLNTMGCRITLSTDVHTNRSTELQSTSGGMAPEANTFYKKLSADLVCKEKLVLY